MDDRRTRGRLERRQQVVDVAMRLFERDGYEATTVEAIAEAAGVSPRSFYRYFESKDGVLATLGTDIMDDLVTRVGPDPSVEELSATFAAVSDERLRGGPVHLLFRLFREQPDLVERAALWRQQWADHLATSLAARAGRGAPSVEELVVCRLAVATITVALDRWLEDGGAGTTAPHVAEALRILRERLS